MGRIYPRVEILPRITARAGQIFSVPFRLVNAVGVAQLCFTLSLHPSIEVQKFEAGKRMKRAWFEIDRWDDKVTISCSLPKSIRTPNQPLGALRVTCHQVISSEIVFLSVSVNGEEGAGNGGKGVVYVA